MLLYSGCCLSVYAQGSAVLQTLLLLRCEEKMQSLTPELWTATLVSYEMYMLVHRNDYCPIAAFQRE
jgi:hypothetical protein